MRIHTCSVCLYLFHETEWLPFFVGDGRPLGPFFLGWGGALGPLLWNTRGNTVKLRVTHTQIKNVLNLKDKQMNERICQQADILTTTNWPNKPITKPNQIIWPVNHSVRINGQLGVTAWSCRIDWFTHGISCYKHQLFLFPKRAGQGIGLTIKKEKEIIIFICVNQNFHKKH